MRATVGSRTVFPASLQQERLWLLDRLEGSNAAYNVSAAWRLRGTLDAERLQDALCEVVARHDALRTRLNERDGAVVQAVSPSGGFVLERVAASNAGEAARLVQEAVREPFDLRTGPLIRARLVRIAPHDAVGVLCAHHTAFDGGSIGIVVSEIETLYNGGTLPDPPLSYGEYATWQRQWMQGEAADRAIRHHTDLLAGASDSLDLPTDRSRPPAPTHAGGTVEVRLGPELGSLAAAEGATPYMSHLSLAGVLLARWTGQSDLVVGIGVSARSRSELEDVVGFLVNTVPVRVDVSGSPSFRDVLAGTRTSLLSALEHPDVPLDRLATALGARREPGRNPLFQAMCTMEPAPVVPRLEGVEAEPWPTDEAAAAFDVQFHLTPTPDGVNVTIGYSTELFDASTMSAFASHLRNLAASATAQPDLCVWDLDMLDPHERGLVVETWNETSARLDDRCVPDMVFGERDPGAVAVEHGDRTRTYAELDERSGWVARRLLAAGGGPPTPIGVLMPRGVELVETLLGVWRAGAAWLPLDPSYPPERLRYMLADSGALIVCALEGTEVPFGEWEVVRIDGDADVDDSIPLPRIRPEDLAYVMYTSGSTGHPKGVMVGHGSLTNYVAWCVERFGSHLACSAAVHSPISFDLTLTSLLGPLACGGRVILADETPGVEGLARVLDDTDDVGVLKLTPAHLDLLAQHFEDHPPRARVGTVVVGGETLKPSQVRHWRRIDPGCDVVNEYGPTETVVGCTLHPVGDEPCAPIPIGRPIANARTYVFGPRLEPVPIGVWGDLYVGGSGVSLGYAGRPDLTAESFLPDPFGPPGSRLYRTGDVARWRADGTLEFAGRSDDQVKVRGYRVELGEVEAVYRAVTGARHVAVDVRADRLVAYVVAEASEAEVREACASVLPEHMVPSAVVAVDAIPLTPNGKVDRPALPDPSRRPDVGDAVPPSTPAERAIAEVWTELLGVEVGVTDDFFRLGGHSLMGVQVLSRIRDRLGVRLPLPELFTHPTVARLARLVEPLVPHAEADDPIPRADRRGVLPASGGQRRLWFLSKLDPHDVSYNSASAYRIRGALDVGALRTAWRTVVRRHETLRMSFSDRGGEPVAVISPEGDVDLEVVAAVTDDPSDEAFRAALEMGVAPFDLERGPLWRAALYRIAPDDHLLAVVMHHAIHDGWSNAVLHAELAEAYSAALAGREPALEPLDVQYADVAAWERARWEDGGWDQSLDWWTSHLAGIPSALELPVDKTRPARPTGAGDTLRVRLPADVALSLEEVARAEGATPFMVLLAAFAAVCGRWAEAEEVVVGTPVAGRHRPEMEGLIGFFANTIALRVDLSGRPRARELIARVRDETLDVLAHQEAPFDRLVESLHPDRDAGRTPVFQVMLSLDTTPARPLALEGLEVREVALDTGTAILDLSCDARLDPQGVELAVNFNTDVFERDTMARLGSHVAEVLRAFAADPDAPADGVVLGTEERELVTELFARHPEEVEPAGTVLDAFVDHARATPQATAVTDWEASLTYGELHEAAVRLAGALHRVGVGRGHPVLVACPRSNAAVAAVLAVWTVGATAVLVDPSHPRARLETQARGTGCRAAVTTSAFLSRIEDLTPVVVEADVGHPAADLPSVDLHPHEVAYVIHTSGSTGVPKGVMVSHSAASAYVRAWQRIVAQDRPWTLACTAAPSFDQFIGDVVRAMGSGGWVLLCPDEAVLDPRALLDLLRENGADHLDLVPSQIRALVSHAEREGASLDFVRRFVGGAEAWDLALWRRLRGVCGPDTEICNIYGVSEATVDSVAYTTPGEPPNTPSLPIGSPMPDTLVYVLDADLRPCPVGVPGELVIGGPAVALGYVGQPDVTAERFVPDPFSGRPGSRMYRTNDRVRWRPDGELEFLGRYDVQLKVRGLRIEPAEVEAAVASHPGVEAAAVAVHRDQLVGYVVASGPHPPPADELHAHAASMLPFSMVPTAWVMLDRLPLTSSGKLDRRALPTPEHVADTSEPPSTPTERRVAEIWSRVIGVEGIAATDDFFAVGGHSLLATQVASRASDALGVTVPVRLLFDHRTVREFAAALEELAPSAAAGLPPIGRSDRSGPLPASFAQQRMWFVHQLDSHNAAYNIPLALRLRGPVDAGALAETVDMVVARHEALRTTFEHRDGTPVQMIAPSLHVDCDVIDLTHLHPDERGSRAARLLTQIARQPFDLRSGPLLRVAVLRLDATEHVLIVCMHHIVSDGWSVGVLCSDMATAYAAALAGTEPAWQPLDVSYADYAIWQRTHLTETMDAQLEWWRERLAGAPEVCELPTDRMRPPVQTFNGATHPFRIETSLADAVRRLADTLGASPFMVLLAAFNVVIGRWTRRDDVVIGSPIAGRTRPELEDVVGFFVNTLTLRTDVGGDPTVRELVARVRETALGAYEHSDVPFERLVEVLRPERDLSHTPLVQVMFALQQPVAHGLPFGAAVADVEEVDRGTVPFDLVCELTEDGDGYSGGLSYNTDLFESSTAARLAEHLSAVVEQMTSGVDEPVGAIVLDRKVSADDNDRPLPEGSVAALVGARAAAEPDRVAVVDATGDMTYAELDERANRLAHHLRARGVGVEDLVAVAVPRSPDIVVTLLGILRAGAAYVPLDPDYPRRRLGFMLADSGARTVVTTSDLASAFAPDRLGEDAPAVVLLDSHSSEIAERPATPPEVEVPGSSLAYVVYTSGSTGTPKGIGITHRCIVRLAFEPGYIDIEPHHVVAQASTVSFDAATFEIWTPLLAGAAVQILDRDVLLSPLRLAQALREDGVTTLFLTTALFNQMADADPEMFSSLDHLLFGGEACDPARVRAVASATRRPRRLFHVYGPTECTTFATRYEVADVGDRATTVPIGRAIDNTRCYVVDAFGHLCPPGVPGELYLGGHGLARGYLGRSDLTAQTFRPDPWGPPGSRMYATGDLVRRRADGELEFMGRLDTQVKVRGFRVEPAEIESALGSHPGVAVCAVVVREDTPGDRRLVAYAVTEASADSLREHLSQRLPFFMIPSAFVRLDSLPLNPNGKVDRAALPAPSVSADGQQPPAEGVEARLAAVWSEVLGLPQVGVDDNFFELGGHSLLVTKAIARIRDVLGVEVDLRTFFQSATIRRLGAEVEALRASGVTPTTLPLRRLPRRGDAT